MGGSKTKTVGGVPVSQTAKNYTNFLSSAINSGGDARNAINQLLEGSSNTANQDLNSFISSLKNFQPTEIQAPQSNIDLSQGIGTVVQQPDLSQFLSQLSNPINPSQSNLNLIQPAGNIQQQDLSGLLARLGNQFNAPQSNLNLTQPSSGIQQPDLSGLLNRLNQNISATGSNVNTQTQSQIDPALKQALTSIIGQQQSNDINSLREQFTANGSGAGSGTPAAYAEAVYRAQAAPQLANALGQLGLQSRQLQQGDINAAINQNQLNQAGNLQAAGLNSNNLSTALQSLLSQGSLASQNQLGNRQIDTSQQGLALQQNQGNVTSQLQANEQNNNNINNILQSLLAQNSLASQSQLGNRQIDTTQQGQALQQNQINSANQLQAAGLTSNNLGTILQSLLNQGSIASQNQLGNRGLDINQLGQILNQSQNNANNILNAANINNQSQQFSQNNLLNIAQLLSGNQNSATQAQLSILAQLFGGLNQANQMGTTQAQTVQTPSGLSQAISGLGAISGAVAPFFI